MMCDFSVRKEQCVIATCERRRSNSADSVRIVCFSFLHWDVSGSFFPVTHCNALKVSSGGKTGHKRLDAILYCCPNIHLSNRTKKNQCVPSISDAVLLRCATKEFKHWDKYAEYLRFFLTRVMLRTSLSMYSTSLDGDRDTCSQRHYWLIFKVTITCLNIYTTFQFCGAYRNTKFR